MKAVTAAYAGLVGFCVISACFMAYDGNAGGCVCMLLLAIWNMYCLTNSLDKGGMA